MPAELSRPELRVALNWFCGCGSPEEAGKTLLDILDMHPLWDEGGERFREMFPGTGPQYVVLNLLDNLGKYPDEWFEHGSSINGQWLTPRGEAVRDALRREWDADEMEHLFRDEGGCVHGFAQEDEGYAEHDCMAVAREEEAAEPATRLTSLQAGLKAEVERLRRIQMHEEGMRGQWEREAPLQDDQAWAAQQVAGASKEAADRLENLLRESEGEAG